MKTMHIAVVIAGAAIFCAAPSVAQDKGKTAAFAVPILSRLDLRQKQPQALVLAPTRELALQVAEAFERYAAHLPGVHVLPIYGALALFGLLFAWALARAIKRDLIRR